MERLKKILVQLLDFFVYSNLLISIASFLFTLQTAVVFNYSANAAVFFAVTNLIATFSLYNLQRIYQSTKPHNSSKLNWYAKNKRLLFTLIFVFVSLYYLILKVNIAAFKTGILLYLPAAIFSLFYFLPPFKFKRFPYFKIAFISLIWVFTSVAIPLMYSNTVFSFIGNFHKNELIYLTVQFCFIAAICIPFDIRDLSVDKKLEIKTLPVHLGIGKAKTIGLILILLYISLIQNQQQMVINFIIGILSIVLIYFSAENKHRFYFSVLVDGLIVLQFILYLLLFARY